eukprot:1142945-Pelagomonas_calceolata.AAC.5
MNAQPSTTPSQCYNTLVALVTPVLRCRTKVSFLLLRKRPRRQQQQGAWVSRAWSQLSQAMCGNEELMPRCKLSMQGG